MLSLLQEASGHENDIISVIIPCYNREKYIADCLDSILCQTIPLDMLEIIVVDDCSTDKTRDILSEYERKFPDQIMVVMCEEQSGGYIGKVRNIGMHYARGQYITFVDSDDIVEKEMLFELYKHALLYQTDITVSGYNTIDEDGNYIEGKFFNKGLHLYECSNIADAKSLMLQEGLSGYIWGKLYKSDYLKEYDICFPEDRHLSEDSFFHGLTLFTCKRLMTLDGCYYNYRVNYSGTWNSEMAPKYVRECFKTQEELLEIEENINRGLSEEMEWCIFGAIYCLLTKCRSMNQEKVFWDMMVEVKVKMLQWFPNLTNNKYLSIEEDEDSIAIYKYIYE